MKVPIYLTLRKCPMRNCSFSRLEQELQKVFTPPGVSGCRQTVRCFAATSTVPACCLWHGRRVGTAWCGRVVVWGQLGVAESSCELGQIGRGSLNRTGGTDTMNGDDRVSVEDSGRAWGHEYSGRRKATYTRVGILFDEAPQQLCTYSTDVWNGFRAENPFVAPLLWVSV